MKMQHDILTLVNHAVSDDMFCLGIQIAADAAMFKIEETNP